LNFKGIAAGGVQPTFSFGGDILETNFKKCHVLGAFCPQPPLTFGVSDLKLCFF